MKRGLWGLLAAAMLAVGCGNNPAQPATGEVAVTVSQGLHAINGGTIDRIIVTLDTSPYPQTVVAGTYELGFNGAEWTALLQGIPAGDITLTAKAFTSGFVDPVFVSLPVEVHVVAGATATAHVLLNQVALQEGIYAPVLDSVTTTDSALRPGGQVTITVCVTDPDGSTVTLMGTDKAAGGSFTPAPPTAVSIPLDGQRAGCGVIKWTAPSTPSGLAPEQIEVQVDDSSGAHVRVQLFFRVIWEASDLQADFELNLAPVVTSLTVAPGNPFDGQGTPLVLGATLGSLAISFTAYDPDAKPNEKMRYEWTIPSSCGEAWKWFTILGTPIAPVYIDAKGDLGGGTQVKSKEHLLAFPFDPPDACTLTLTLTDGQGAVTVSTLVIRPFDVVMQYTPTLEISYQNGSLARDGYQLDFGVMSFIRVYDDYIGPPTIRWALGFNAPWGTPVTPLALPLVGPDFRFASNLHWDVGLASVACELNGGKHWVPVTVQACNPVHTTLCDTVAFRVEADANVCTP